MSDANNYAEDDGFSLVSLAHGLLVPLLALKGRSLQLGRRHGRRTFALSPMLDFKHLEHGHLKVLSSGKLVCPQFSQTNRPFGKTVMGRNSSPTTQ